MSSNNKQQKRAKRAAAKAKQNRMVRNGNAAPRDSVLEASVVDLILSGFDSGHYQRLYPKMYEAEKISFAQMFVVFFDDPFTQVAEDDYTVSYAFYVEKILCAYHHWRHNSTKEEATAWYLSEEIQDAFMDGADIQLNRHYLIES